MSRSLRTTWILAPAAILIATFALVPSGCSVKDTIIGSTTTASLSTTSTSPTGGSGEAGSTETTKPLVSGKTREEYEALIPHLVDAVNADPTDLIALQALAVAQYKSGKYGDAAATYLKMLEIQDEPLTHNNYANVLRDAGKIGEAKAEYEKALAADPTLTVAYLNLAVVYAGEDNIARAIEVLDRGLAAITGDDLKRLQTYKDKLTGKTATT